ncbi:MAG: hypothetical protein PUP90_28170 [Nostoc sp. S4]|nr:hypothetical protein [Nostoc sp. S4]
MKSNTRYHKPRKSRPSEERDYLLIFLLAVFNVVSGYTTIKGVKILLNNLALAAFLGGFIQLALFLTLAEFMLRRAHLRKWITVIFFTFGSVYTSFFTYYTNQASEINTVLANNKATQAHNKLVADVYTPMNDYLSQLQQDAKILRRKADEEVDTGLTTGIVGRGKVAKNFEEQALEKEEEAKQFEKTVNDLRPKFNYDLKGLPPEEILERDRDALATVPQRFRNNYEYLKRSNYINSENDVSILTPYLKLNSQDIDEKRPAFISLLIATLIDGMSILLGTAITIKRDRRSPILRFARFIANIISDIKSAFTEIRDALIHPAKGDEKLSEASEMLTLELRGRGSDFLKEFRRAIHEKSPHNIDRSFFETHPEQSYLDSFDILIDQLSNPQLGWIGVVNNSNYWQVRDEYYHKTVEWLRQEILRLTQEESLDKSKYDNLFTFKNVTRVGVKVKIPSIQNGNHNSVPSSNQKIP